MLSRRLYNFGKEKNMAKILRKTDRVKVKIGEVAFYLAPYTQEQKQEINSLTKVESGTEVIDAIGRIKLALKYCVKGVEGIETVDGEEYQLSFDDNGDLTDETIDEIYTIEINNELVSAAIQLSHSIPEEIIDPLTAKPFENISVEYVSGNVKK
jgi:hypothetical protein